AALQLQEHGLAARSLEAERRVAGQSRLSVPREAGAGKRRQDRRDEEIPRLACLLGPGLALRLREGERGREADRTRDILRTGATPGLLASPVHERLERDAPAHEERADPLGSPQLVPGERHRLDGEAVPASRSREPEIKPAGGLDGIRVQW